MKKFYILMAIVAASVATLVLKGHETESDQAESVHQPGKPLPLATKELPTIPPFSRATPTVAVAPGLAEELRQASSLRSFVYRAIRAPERGGYLYAQHVISQCAKIRKLKDRQFTSDGQRAALTTLVQRCDMTKEDLVQYERELPELRDGGKDPLLSLVTDGMIGALSQAERNIASQKILSLREPLLLRSVQSVEMELRANGTSSFKEYLNGIWYGEEKAEAMNLAWSLALCDFGSDCSASGAESLKVCIEKAWCGGTLQEAIEHGVAKKESVDEIQRLRNMIVSAVKRNDTSAFIGPRGNPPLLQ